MINFSGRCTASPREFGQNTAKNVEGLTKREEEILAQIREKVSSGLGVPVKFNFGERFECGRTIAFLGMRPPSVDAPRSAFLVTKGLLQEMAACEIAFEKGMAMVRQQITQTIEAEKLLQANNKSDCEDETERRASNLRLRMMVATDFWNEDGSSSRSWVQMAQNNDLGQTAGLYEKMLIK